MMKRLLLSILFLFFPAMLCAAEPVIHVIIASDIRAGFNANLISDSKNIERLFKENVPKERLRLVPMKGDEITPENILQAVKDIGPVTQNDTLIFYFSGHAASEADGSVGDGGQFFQLKDEQGKSVELHRRTLLAALHEKKARLTVLLTDCGNIEERANETQKTQGTARGGVGGIKSEQSLPKTMSPIMETLFIKPEGTVNITSSKRGEASFVDTSEKKRGSCFTWSLVALFEKYQMETEITWKEFTETLAVDVKQAFLDSYPPDRYPDGYKFSSPLNGSVQQTTQTIEVYTLPGMESAPTIQQGPRFGVRAVTLPGSGVRITQILPGGPGARAGFEVGDIITEIDGKKIQNEEDYSKAIDDSPKKVNAKVINVKDGRLLNVTFELGY